MTSKVALQATKRRKMGYDVDFIDDSGYPMDGVELDSSTSATTATAASSTATRSNPSPLHNQRNCVNNNITTSSTNHYDQQLHQQNNIASTTNNSASANSSTENLKQQQQNQQQQQQQQQQANQDNSSSNDMTNNEAMTTDDPASLSNNDELKFGFGNSDSPDFGQAHNDLRSSAPPGVNSLFRLGNQASVSDNQHNQSGLASNPASHSMGIIIGFGDLFDDDDLD